MTPTKPNDLHQSQDIKGGFFNLPKRYACRDPEHHAPTHIHIPAGKGYRHVCPTCGAVQTIVSLKEPTP